MTAHRLLILAAIVLASSACASNADKSQAVPPLSAIPEAPMEVAVGQHDTVSTSTLAVPLVIGVPPSNGTSGAAASTESPTDARQDAALLHQEAIVKDPWEGYNRRMHSFNNMIDKYVARPLAVAYDKVTPQPVQSSVTRFFGNLREPGTAVNQTLQGRPLRALQSLGRFAVNTTIGVGGLFDPATNFGMPKGDGEDFGQTLATWGWRDSRYFVMPLFGPRTVRDTIGMVGDQPLSPIGYVEDSGVANGLRILQLVDARSRALPMDDARHQALDEYALVRDAWIQRRNRQIDQDLPSSHD